MDVVPSHVGDMCVFVEYMVDSLKQAGGGHEHRERIPFLFSTSVMVYFTCRQGHRTDGLASPPKDNWWFIGASVSAGLIDKQHHKNGFMAKYVALCLSMWLYG